MRLWHPLHAAYVHLLIIDYLWRGPVELPGDWLGEGNALETAKTKHAMKAKDILTIASVACGTATLTVMLLWSASLEAGNEAETLSPTVVKPKLVSHGVEITLDAAGGQTFKAWEEPTFDLQAFNPTAEPVSVTVRLSMTAASPRDVMSRVIRLPSVLWQHKQTLALNPHETKTIPVSTRTKLPPNNLISVNLHAADSAKIPSESTATAVRHAVNAAPASAPGILALSFSTAGPAVQLVATD